jgi:hypothetical protein
MLVLVLMLVTVFVNLFTSPEKATNEACKQ